MVIHMHTCRQNTYTHIYSIREEPKILGLDAIPSV